MAIPEADLLCIGQWCREQIPAHLLNQVRVECEIAARHVTIFETRPPWDGVGEEWTQFPVARLRFVARTGLWTLYFRDRNLKFHEYTRMWPTADVRVLLAFLGSPADPIFWG